MMSMAEFGKYIYCKRKEKGFTQETFASLLGITPQAVSKWENGIGYPDITLFQEIARVLGVSIDDLFGNKSAGVIEDSPDTLNGLAKIAVFGNRTCYSDKTVSDISGNTVNFSDGSKADLLDGSVLNIGKGEVCFFEAEPSAKQYEESGPTEFEKVFEHFSGISSTLNGAYDLEILSSKDGVFKVMADGSSNFITDHRKSKSYQS